MSKVATRFAPSPTGPLHIGGVRTALFNWLFSKNQKGNFYLRIEDTDKERSKDEYKEQIIQSLKWIGIQHDKNEYIQSTKLKLHVEIANILLENKYMPTPLISVSGFRGFSTTFLTIEFLPNLIVKFFFILVIFFSLIPAKTHEQL